MKVLRSKVLPVEAGVAQTLTLSPLVHRMELSCIIITHVCEVWERNGVTFRQIRSRLEWFLNENICQDFEGVL
jgi:hypothetical protein